MCDGVCVMVCVMCVVMVCGDGVCGDGVCDGVPAAGSQICTCGADGVVKIFDIHNKSEVISKRTEDIFL